MTEMISIVKTRDNQLEFDINITGAQKKEPTVRLVIENGKVNYTFDCSNLKGSKWVCAVPPLPELTRKSYPFRLEVIIDGYFFEPYKKTLNIISDPIVKSSNVAEKHPAVPVVKKENPPTKTATKTVVTPKEEPKTVTKEEVYIPEPIIQDVVPVEAPKDDFANMASAWLNRPKAVVTEQDKKVKGLIKDALQPKVVTIPEEVAKPYVAPPAAIEIPKSTQNDIKIKAILDSAKPK